MIKKIIIHKGQAHRDELLALALLFATKGRQDVCRRDATEEELNDPEVVVLDVGGKYQPNLNNFDHHQRGRDEAPECAYTLLAQSLDLEEVLSFQKWYYIGAMMDAQGPFAVSKELGLSKFPFELSSPIELAILDIFKEEEMFKSDDLIIQLIEKIGIQIIKNAKEYQDSINNLKELCIVKELLQLQILVFKTDKTLGSGDLKDKFFPEAAISVCWDDRGKGWTLYRFNDHPKVNFSLLEKKDQILFAHKGGFIAKTKERISLDEVLSLVGQAII